MAIEKYIDEKGQVRFRRVDEKDKLNKDQTFVNNLDSVDPPEVDNAVGYAFKLGLSDTYRGVKQIANLDIKAEKDKQKKLNELMRGPNGKWVTAAYFGGALLDPASWLVPFGKAKFLYQMGKYGMVSGAIAGATGYVDDENPLIDSRFKQATLGAVGGGIVATGIGGLKKAKFKLTGKGQDIPLFKVQNLSEEETLARGGTKVQVQGASRTGRAVDEETNKVKPIETTGKETLVISADKDIAKETPSVLDNLLKIFSKSDTKIPFPFTKRRNDIPKKIDDKPIWFLSRMLRGFQNNYEKRIGKKLLSKVSTGEGGTAFAGGVTGFIIDPTDDGEAPALSSRFARMVMGAAAGYGGIKFLKSKTATEGLGIRRETVLGEGADQEVFIESYPELFGRLFVDRVGLPKKARQLEIAAQGLETVLASQMVRIAKKADELTLEENKLLYNLLEGDEITDLSGKVLTKNSDEVPEKIARLAKIARGRITKMTQMYIDLGLLTRETAARNQKKYLMRLYAKGRIKGGSEKAKSINLEVKRIGDELRNRGLVKEYTVNDYLTKLRFDKNTVDGVEDTGHRGWELPPDIKIINGKLYKVQTKTKATVDKETKQPLFEEIVDETVERKLLKPTDKVELRWEYSKPERKFLGEVENAAISMEYTGMIMSRTIAKYQYFADVAAKFAADPRGKTKAQMADLPGRFLKIPDAKIDGTETFKYGKLAGKYVPEVIYKDVVGMKKYQDQTSNILWEGYKSLNRLWKVSKTAWNPTVHVNNVFGNIILSDLADVPLTGLPAAWKAIRANANGVGENSDIVELAKFHGVLDADFLRREFGNFKIEKLAGIYSSKGEQTEWSNAVGFAKNIYNKVRTNDITGTLENWYKVEDHVFRLNAFMHRIKMGDSYEDAAMFARKQFIDYDIQAPAINALRNSMTPFISFTYRMIPILVETAVLRPTKYVKYAVLGAGLTQLEGMYGGEEAKKERALLPDYEAGNILDLPFMPKKSIRIPMKDQNGRPKFVNISRLFPGGDVLSMDGKNPVPFLPEPLQPSFGVGGDFIMSMIGYDMFTGQKAANRGDGGWVEETTEAFDMFGKKLIPNFPYLPGSFSAVKLERARKGDKSPYRVQQTELEALFSTFGVKVSNKSVRTLRASKKIELSNDLRKQKRKISNLKREYVNKKIDREEYKKKVAKVKTRIQELQMTYFGRLQGNDPYAFRWFDGLEDIFS